MLARSRMAWRRPDRLQQSNANGWKSPTVPSVLPLRSGGQFLARLFAHRGGFEGKLGASRPMAAALTADLASSFCSATDRTRIRPMNRHADAEPAGLCRSLTCGMNDRSQPGFQLVFAPTSMARSKSKLRERDEVAGLTVRRGRHRHFRCRRSRKLFDRSPSRGRCQRGRSFEGSGIGLALVRELVKLHHGDIAVESEEGRGTAFHITVPLGTAHIPPERVKDRFCRNRRQRHCLANSLSRRRCVGFRPAIPCWMLGQRAGVLHSDAAQERRLVLLADDNADLRDYISRLLASHEVRCRNGSGWRGGAWRGSVRGTAAGYPGHRCDDAAASTGLACSVAARDDASLRDLPVVMLSARAGDDAKVEGLDASAGRLPASSRFPRANCSLGWLRTLRWPDCAAKRWRQLAPARAKAREQAERVQLALDAGAIIGTWVWNVRTDHFVGDERFARSFGLDPARCQAGLQTERSAWPRFTKTTRRVLRRVKWVRPCGAAGRTAAGSTAVSPPRRRACSWIEANGRVDQDADGAVQHGFLAY